MFLCLFDHARSKDPMHEIPFTLHMTPFLLSTGRERTNQRCHLPIRALELSLVTYARLLSMYSGAHTLGG